MREVLNKISPTCEIYKVPIECREGPVHAVSLIFDKIEDDKEVIVSYCDYGTYWNYTEFLHLLTFQMPNTFSYNN
jgi:hypothetical protein